MEQTLNRRLVFDVGMHIGQDTEFYLKKGFWVVAIEANPVLIKEAEKKFKKFIDEGRLKLENVGISDKYGEVDFYINRVKSAFSSFDKNIATRGFEVDTIKIKALKLSDILKKYGTPYYIKIDIEGNDYIAINSLSSIEVRPKYLSVENGQKPLLEKLVALGYERFKFVNQAEVVNQALPNPSLEGDYVDFKFTHGSSGAFGFEAPGRWLSYDEVLLLIEAYYGIKDRDPNVHGWYDLHAMTEPKA